MFCINLRKFLRLLGIIANFYFVSTLQIAQIKVVARVYYSMRKIYERARD